MEQKYTQVKIKYTNGFYEVSWIPEEFAKINKAVVIGKNKQSGRPATVVEVWGGDLTKSQVEINRTHPLKAVTDI
jgi:uncharacterized protein YifN (PemK superfamily)